MGNRTKIINMQNDKNKSELVFAKFLPLHENSTLQEFVIT